MNKPKTEYTESIMKMFYEGVYNPKTKKVEKKTLPEIARIVGKSYNTVFQHFKRKNKEYLKTLNNK